MNIYLDIDGVLLKKDGTIANHLEEFLEFMLENNNVFWLTTHCRGGENRAIEHITSKNSVSEKSLALLEKIKPTDWGALKTDAIDFSTPFAWIDDYVMGAEKKILLENNALTCLHEVNVNESPDLLATLIKVHFERPAVSWQKFDFEISFSEEELELIKKDFILGFSLQEAKSGRDDRESVYELERILRNSLKETNWRLMSDGVNYRLGFLTGRLKGLEGEEKLLNLVETDLKKRNKRLS